ncbi:hypothetical protein [Paramesorhizobium deserti]|nr:hypothetical protein [Paramesorhizobium deserti]
MAAAFAYYFLTSNAGLEAPAPLPQDNSTTETPAAPSATAPADDTAALQKAGCTQSARELGFYQGGTVPEDVRPRDILSAEVRYCIETGILTKEETAGLDLSD